MPFSKCLWESNVRNVRSCFGAVNNPDWLTHQNPLSAGFLSTPPSVCMAQNNVGWITHSKLLENFCYLKIESLTIQAKWLKHLNCVGWNIDVDSEHSSGSNECDTAVLLFRYINGFHVYTLLLQNTKFLFKTCVSASQVLQISYWFHITSM